MELAWVGGGGPQRRNAPVKWRIEELRWTPKSKNMAALPFQLSLERALPKQLEGRAKGEDDVMSFFVFFFLEAITSTGDRPL